MDEFVDITRTLIVLGLALLLFMLRLDAERFGTAEYYEAEQNGERPRARRRLAWYGIGVALAIAIVYVHPSPQQTLFLGSGNRLGAVLGGLAYGARRRGRRGGVRDRPLPPHPVPGAVVLPGRAAELGGHGLHRRGRLPRRALRRCCSGPASSRRWRTSSRPSLYALTTRLGAPGRDRYLLILALGMGLVGGWLTAWTGGIAAAFLGHAITRFAVFLCTGHTGQTKPRGREVEEIEKRRRVPEGWRVIGSRER